MPWGPEDPCLPMGPGGPGGQDDRVLVQNSSMALYWNEVWLVIKLFVQSVVSNISYYKGKYKATNKQTLIVDYEIGEFYLQKSLRTFRIDGGGVQFSLTKNIIDKFSGFFFCVALIEVSCRIHILLTS